MQRAEALAQVASDGRAARDRRPAALSARQRISGTRSTALSGRYRVRAIDLHGHGPARQHGQTPFTLADDARSSRRCSSRPDRAWSAIPTAARSLKHGAQPGRVKSAVAYEPVLFHAPRGRRLGAAGARHARDRRLGPRLPAHRWPIEAARRFVDFWSGRGGFDRMAPARRGAIADGWRRCSCTSKRSSPTPSTGELQRLAMPRSFTGTKTVATRARLGSCCASSCLPQRTSAYRGISGRSRTPTPSTRVAAFLAEPTTPGLRLLAFDGDGVDAHHRLRPFSAPRFRSGNRRMR
jgi:hypothetical protein